MPRLLGNSSSREEAAVYYASGSIVSMAIFIIVFIIGIPGNGLVIWVAGLKMKRSVNIIWFLNLAAADFMCCLSLLFSIVHLALREHWPYGWFLCKVIPSVIIFTMFASVFILVAISIDRCLLVMKPVWCQNHRTGKFVSLICSGIWILAFIFCCPVLHYRETSTHDGKTECGYNFGDDEVLDYMNDSINEVLEKYSFLAYNGNDSWANFYESDYSVPLAIVVINITRAVFGFVLPFGIVAFCYALIAFRTRANRFHKPHNRMLRTIVLVIAAFFICWAPYHVVGILSLVPTLETGLRESLILWDHLSTALAYANSCINPLLYVFVGRDFRAKARQSVQGILEGAFTEEPTHSTPYSFDRSKTSTEKDISSTV
ncbi:C3AR protein, partial [Rissa tridactyla]|nr:C3a anaphylatoxin chemotactic receptor [Rissa tridactyla]XP_054045046.1 C3a anaphylatoxin chemotactic receptor [Rissa tridactyla]XP_054045048.1 C3a anaphylatoxin chemotactic receptor [Rissa tridactyla]XP_054045049.1 C3a anaphylatoxin chemotactic receptor [Rissa tridactyla]NXX05371.1 C3AR protein [Larus smithsonianus]NXV39909.1 C3AR protein [Rissa tridactyla]